MDERVSQTQNVNKKQRTNTQFINVKTGQRLTGNARPYEQNVESFLMKNPQWIKEEYLIEKELVEILKSEESFDAYLKSINLT